MSLELEEVGARTRVVRLDHIKGCARRSECEQPQASPVRGAVCPAMSSKIVTALQPMQVACALFVAVLHALRTRCGQLSSFPMPPTCCLWRFARAARAFWAAPV